MNRIQQKMYQSTRVFLIVAMVSSLIGCSGNEDEFGENNLGKGTGKGEGELTKDGKRYSRSPYNINNDPNLTQLKAFIVGMLSDHLETLKEKAIQMADQIGNSNIPGASNIESMLNNVLANDLKKDKMTNEYMNYLEDSLKSSQDDPEAFYSDMWEEIKDKPSGISNVSNIPWYSPKGILIYVALQLDASLGIGVGLNRTLAVYSNVYHDYPINEKGEICGEPEIAYDGINVYGIKFANINLGLGAGAFAKGGLGVVFTDNQEIQQPDEIMLGDAYGLSLGADVFGGACTKMMIRFKGSKPQLGIILAGLAGGIGGNLYFSGNKGTIITAEDFFKNLISL